MTARPRPIHPHRRLSRWLALLAVLALGFSSGPVAAVVDDGERTPEPESGRHLVLFEAAPLAAYGGGIDGLAPTDPEVTGDSRLDPDSAASRAYLAFLAEQRAARLAAIAAALGRDVEAIFTYEVTLNGVALDLSAAEATTVASVPGVARVAPDETRYLQTDNGPDWMSAASVWEGEATGGLPGTRGEGIVVGVIDSGVNFGHPSFAATGGDGHTHTNPHGTYHGLCDPLTGAPFCNDKLIGVWDFTGTGPQDTNGHGSHTASTSAGNVLTAVLDAPTITIERPISGVAPHANLITYKVCPDISCSLAAILAAIDQAPRDGVDVINYSIGGTSANPWTNPDSQAFLNARRAGVFIATSAGNAGPGAATVGRPADSPWVLTVGASTHDRKFVNGIVNMEGSDAAPPPDLFGKSVTEGYGPAPIVYAGDFGDDLCASPFLPGTFDGEIVVCDRGVTPRVEKARNVQIGGGGGMVLANEEATGDSTVADPYVIPGVNISHADGLVLKAWVASGEGHTGTILGTTVDENPEHGDVMAAFSSRGPNPSVPDVLKPDVTAPGVDILAAFAVDPTVGDEYGVISGTSMSSPHVAGSAALIRALHPDWTPDEVKSALMTSAFDTMPGHNREVHGVLKEDASTPADPFDHGAGRVDLARAGLVGLVLDETAANYDAANPALGGDPRALNIASLADDECAGVCSWERTLTSTAGGSVTWTSTVTAPGGMALSVSPTSFEVGAGESLTIEVTADVSGLALETWAFAEVRLEASDGAVPDVRLPVVVRPVPAPGEVPDRVTLHFQGNLDEGCTGDGRTDLVACDGPFLAENDELDDNPAARWVVSSLVNGTADRNIHDPNWVWNLDAPTTVEGPMTVHWWGACPGCGIFGDDWTIRLWADGQLVTEQRITASPPSPGVAGPVQASINVPETTAESTFVLHVDPVYIDTMNPSVVYYDSTGSCDGQSSGPCESFVLMPVIGEEALPDLVVSAIEASRERPRASEPVTITATIENVGDGDAVASHTEISIDGVGELGVVETAEIPAGGSATVSVEWDTRGLNGEHVVRVTADVEEALAETDEENNVATRQVTVRGNRVENGSFEQANAEGDGPAAWEGRSTGAGSLSWSEGAADGERSVTISGTGGNVALAGAPTWTSAPIAVEAGEVLTLTAGVSVDGASSAPTVGVSYLGAAGELLGTVTLLTAPLTTGGFELLEETLTVPGGATELRIVLQGFALTDVATKGSVTFDDVGLFAE